MWLRVLPWLGWPAAALLVWFYLGERDNRIEAETTLDDVSVDLEAEQLSHAATREEYQRRIAEREAAAKREREARQAIERERLNAEQRIEEAETTIQQLMIEAATDDIPDSDECLNVFYTHAAIDELRLRDEVCGIAAEGGSCVSGSRPGTAHRTATDTHSTLTIGDGLTLWKQDRENLRLCNSQLRQIGTLQDAN